MGKSKDIENELAREILKYLKEKKEPTKKLDRFIPFILLGYKAQRFLLSKDIFYLVLPTQ